MQAAQVCVARHALQHEDDKKNMEKMIHELQGAVAKLQSDATAQKQDPPSEAATFVQAVQKKLQPTMKAVSRAKSAPKAAPKAAAKAPPLPPPLPASSSFALAVAVPANDMEFDWNEDDDENQLGHSCEIEFAEPVLTMNDTVAVHPAKVPVSERDDLASLESFKKQRVSHQQASPFVHNSQFKVLESSAASSVTGPP